MTAALSNCSSLGSGVQRKFSPAMSMRIPQNLGGHITHDQVGTVFVTEKGAANMYIGIIAETRTLWGKVGHTLSHST